jgi:predicted helicase
MAKVVEDIKEYISEISNKYKNGITTEHSFRGALETLLKNMTNCKVINEARHIKCGAPDLTLLRKEIPIGYVEAKDIGKNLNSKEYKNQFDRYKKALDNLIITDYLHFQLFKGEILIAEIAIGKILPNKIEPIPANFNAFVEMIKEFSLYSGKAIKDSQILAEYMAAKTQLLAEVIEKTIADNDESNSLRQQFKGFKKVLLSTMTDKTFADIYAQTIAYGMFVARLRDFSNDNFTRRRAEELIPKSNPFLRNFFHYIAGFDIDENIRWIVDSLADIFNHANVPAIRNEFISKDKDPFLHFYEDFLTKYDKNLKTAMGAYYTPLAVVKFIVKAIDDILKVDFNISDGLADESMIETLSSQRFHRVQILDPATGTGTFLAEVVRAIHRQFGNNAGMWNDYVKNHLIPRLNGFEIMMAPYTMAHLKIEMILQEMGCDSRQEDITPSRLHIYLTNALEKLENSEEGYTEISFEPWLSNEINEAEKIKENAPVMVVLGNPPYSGESKNKSKWITKLMEDYKKEPDTNSTLQERNSKWINDDYCKFIRLGQFFVNRSKEGILAYINNHSFIDNPTFRGMRWNLMKSFDKIYIIDLHGNSKKKEVCPDGSKDENVFDIQQGVSINIFVKTGRKAEKALAEVYHFDICGKREEKYGYLLNNKLSAIPFVHVEPTAPFYFFMPKDYETEEEYEKGFKIQELFPTYSLGLITKRDKLSISYSEKELINKISFFLDESNPIKEVCNHFEIPLKDNDKWDALISRTNTKKQNIKEQIENILYRPFDIRKVFYNEYFVARLNKKVLINLQNNNYAIIIGRQGQAVGDAIGWNIVFMTNSIIDQNIFYRGGGSVFPLYLYPETNKIFKNETRKPNLNKTIIEDISQRIKLQFTEEKEKTANTFSPIDVLDYIYAVLHSPAYRERYKEFLKIDFPRVPYPENAEQFWKLVELGGKLRRLHLLEGVEPQQGMADFPVKGTSEVEKPEYKDGKVWINDKQYFDNVPSEAWSFYIGGYQPAQKWLKDRKGRKLGYDDIRHYQRIVKVLKETGEIMVEIDKVMQEREIKGG